MRKFFILIFQKGMFGIGIKTVAASIKG